MNAPSREPIWLVPTREQEWCKFLLLQNPFRYSICSFSFAGLVLETLRAGDVGVYFSIAVLNFVLTLYIGGVIRLWKYFVCLLVSTGTALLQVMQSRLLNFSIVSVASSLHISWIQNTVSRAVSCITRGPSF